MVETHLCRFNLKNWLFSLGKYLLEDLWGFEITEENTDLETIRSNLLKYMFPGLAKVYLDMLLRDIVFSLRQGCGIASHPFSLRLRSVCLPSGQLPALPTNPITPCPHSHIGLLNFTEYSPRNLLSYSYCLGSNLPWEGKSLVMWFQSP